MSTPWWNEKKPGPSKPPERTPFSNTVRGSPKKPRIGCCLWNGLIGHGYDDPALAETSASVNAMAMRPRSRNGVPGMMGRVEDAAVRPQLSRYPGPSRGRPEDIRCLPADGRSAEGDRHARRGSRGRGALPDARRSHGH